MEKAFQSMATEWGKPKSLPYCLRVNLGKLVEFYIKVSIIV